jgi:hypothetical protein
MGSQERTPRHPFAAFWSLEKVDDENKPRFGLSAASLAVAWPT